MPVLSTTAKVSLAVGAVAVAVGAFMLYKRAAATAGDESEEETDSEEEEEVTTETSTASTTKVRRWPQPHQCRCATGAQVAGRGLRGTSLATARVVMHMQRGQVAWAGVHLQRRTLLHES